MVNQGSGILRIGTSGIVVPGNKKSFPAEFQLKSRLNYYSSLFNTLEVNSTFQKLPMPSTLLKWSLDVPQEFQFTFKLWREITHVKQLKTDFNNIEIFFKAAENIGNKKACLLVQFPGSITAEYSLQVEQILQKLRQPDDENQWQKAIEFRSKTWYNDQTFDLLNKYGVSLVLHDMPKSKNLEFNGPAQFVYCRFHGPKGDYKGSYSKDFLEEQSEKIRSWLNGGKDVYVYFNNTMGNAFENAMNLKELLDE